MIERIEICKEEVIIFDESIPGTDNTYHFLDSRDNDAPVKRCIILSTKLREKLFNPYYRKGLQVFCDRLEALKRSRNITEVIYDDSYYKKDTSVKYDKEALKSLGLIMEYSDSIILE